MHHDSDDIKTRTYFGCATMASCHYIYLGLYKATPESRHRMPWLLVIAALFSNVPISFEYKLFDIAIEPTAPYERTP